MRTLKNWILAASFGLAATPAWSQVIPVSTFGSDASSSSINEEYAGNSFGQNSGWTVTSGTVETIGTYWQTPDGNLTVDMDGISVGAISTTIDVPAAGNVSITFDLAGNPDGGQAVKQLQVQLGSATAQDFSFDTTGHSDGSMGWTSETAVFNVAAGLQTLSFASLDDPPSDWGPAIATVTAFDQSANAPDGGVSFILLSLSGSGLVWLRKRMSF